MDVMQLLAEKKIKEAIERGELEDLPGAGKPLQLDSNPYIPAELRMAFTILKNAGLVPREVTLIKEISQLKKKLLSVANEEEREAITKSLREKEITLQILLERPARLGKPVERYYIVALLRDTGKK